MDQFLLKEFSLRFLSRVKHGTSSLNIKLVFVTPTDEPINDQQSEQVQNMNLFSDKVKKLYDKFSNKTINTLYNSLNTIETEYKDIYAHTIN